MSFLTLPVLYWDGEEICTSTAIGRFVAKKVGMYGRGEVQVNWFRMLDFCGNLTRVVPYFQEARVDAILDHVSEIFNSKCGGRICSLLSPQIFFSLCTSSARSKRVLHLPDYFEIRFHPDEEAKRTKKEAFRDRQFPNFLQVSEKRLRAAGGEYFAGSQVRGKLCFIVVSSIGSP